MALRVLTVRRRSRANYQNFLVQNYFPVTRRPSEKISQTAMRIVRGRLLDPVPPPPPGKWAPGPGPLAPLRSESVSGWAQIATKFSLFWSHARHTFCNSGKFRFFGDGVPAPLRSLVPPWGGPMGPLLRRTHGKNIASFCMPGTLFVIPKSHREILIIFATFPSCQSALRHKAIFRSFSTVPKYSSA